MFQTIWRWLEESSTLLRMIERVRAPFQSRRRSFGIEGSEIQRYRHSFPYFFSIIRFCKSYSGTINIERQRQHGGATLMSSRHPCEALWNSSSSLNALNQECHKSSNFPARVYLAAVLFPFLWTSHGSHACRTVPSWTARTSRGDNVRHIRILLRARLRKLYFFIFLSFAQMSNLGLVFGPEFRSSLYSLHFDYILSTVPKNLHNS